MRLSRIASATLLVTAMMATTLTAQRKLNAVEVRGGVAVPGFDFADVSNPGPTFGVGYRYNPTGAVWVMFDADYSSQPAADEGIRTTIVHLIGKVGVDLTNRSNPWSFILNVGAGVMLFDFDTETTPFDNKTYFGSNLGAKAGYAVSPNITVYLNAQADMALSESSGAIPTSNTWVFPLTAGLAYA
ncbi:MAG: porin family protein, partial [Gemmatimonadota bacterium]